MSNTMQNRVVKLFATSLFASSVAMANITGTVYKDFNLNGQKDTTDTGVLGVSVQAICEGSATPITTTTALDGTYTLATPAGKKCRVEADSSSVGLGSAANSGGSSPLVSMVEDGTSNHNISLASPSTYCQDSPDLAMTVLPGGKIPDPKTFGSLFVVKMPADGVYNNDHTIRVEKAQANDTGAIWGLAWAKATKKLYTAANVKRYVDLKGDNAGAIYVTDHASTTTSLLTTVAGTGFTLTNRDMSENKDEETIPFMGRSGLGDLDISEDETKLYTINLKTKELVTIDLANPSAPTTEAIPNPYANGECPDEDVRPWALKVKGADIYIGSVCESKIEAGVGAKIQKYNGAIISTIASTNTLRFLRPKSYAPTGQTSDYFQNVNWNPTVSWHPHKPILSDIEFDNNGDMILGYSDLGAMAKEAGNAMGDIRRMCLNADGSYTEESTAAAPTNCTSHTSTYDGNPEVYHEFYTGDEFGGFHPEVALGALSMRPGASSVITAAWDATDWYQAAGVILLDNTSGEKVAAQGLTTKAEPERSVYGAKAGGIGDIELLCDPAPIEIGNYVWDDTNADGIQDPDEPALSGVVVTLTCDGNAMGTATTDANGHYYFGGANNANLTGGNSLTPNTTCQLRVADKTPRKKDAGTNDSIDSDATAEGADSVIDFTTKGYGQNDHTLDFGIAAKVGCVSGTLFNDVNGDGTNNETDVVAPAGIKLTIIDAYGKSHETQTDAAGAFTLLNVPVGNVTVKVDTTDTDIPEGAVWSSAIASNITVSEGVAPNCALTPFGFTLPAPTAQDPKDVAVCAKPTSITWEGATVSSESNWTSPVVDVPATFTTVGGSPVDVTMKIINDNNTEYNRADSGTSAAFEGPYLTLYLGDQAEAGNGTWQNAANCAANGYDLEAGESYDLEVTFAEPVILDNWRIRDVDSGDDRNGNANWNWQDGIKVAGFDANGDAVTVEPKIGSAGVGLMVDANGIVHTDSGTYNGGDFAIGAGSTPNATNGHIVLSSNMVPVSKIVITHVAGPDVPCQTRSALAMAGLAVCKPLHISGTVYNDKDGAKPAATCDTSNNTVDGTPINDINGSALHACLLDNQGKVLDTQALNNGAYDFDKYILPHSNYKVLITTATCTKGNAAPSATLAPNWNYEGEDIAGTLDAVADGLQNVAVTDTSVPEIDFGLNKAPTAQGYTRALEVNPGGTTAVQIAPDGTPIEMFIADKEETTPTRIEIVTLPSNGKLYYEGALVTLNQKIDNPVVSGFTFDPNDGDVEAAFSYVSVDKACRKSEPAFLKSTFGVPKISGFLYLDKNNNGQVDDTGTAKSCDDTTSLFVNLISKADNKVISATALTADGSYIFYNPDVQPNTSYDLVLSQVEGEVGDTAPSADLPEGCMNTAENKGTNPTNPEGSAGDGIITVDVGTVDVPELNFGISPSVKIGDRVWIEDDNDGDAKTGKVTPVVGTTVTANCAGIDYTATTDAAGIYGIEVPQNSTCTVSLPAPQKRAATAGSTDSDVSDTTSENDKSHNPEGTTVTVGTTDNLTLDFGFTGEPSSFLIGTHFWIDKNANGVFEASEKPVANALVELFDANGAKLKETKTDAKGAYRFDVAAGTYQVKFNIPNTPAYEGYVFSQPKGNDNDQTNINSANNKGFTKTVTVGPGAKMQDLTLDAGINCGCSNVSSDSSDAKSTLSMLAMMLFTLMTALFFVRREEIEYKNENE